MVSVVIIPENAGVRITSKEQDVIGMQNSILISVVLNLPSVTATRN